MLRHCVCCFCLRPPSPFRLRKQCAGGYLGVNLAARHPEAIRGLILLNATPFWSQRPPAGQENLLWRTLNVDAALPVKHVSVCVCCSCAFGRCVCVGGVQGWRVLHQCIWPLPFDTMGCCVLVWYALLCAGPHFCAHCPPLFCAPAAVSPATPSLHTRQGFKTAIEQLWWNRIRTPETIRSLLQLVYARPSAVCLGCSTASTGLCFFAQSVGSSWYHRTINASIIHQANTTPWDDDCTPCRARPSATPQQKTCAALQQKACICPGQCCSDVVLFCAVVLLRLLRHTHTG